MARQTTPFGPIDPIRFLVGLAIVAGLSVSVFAQQAVAPVRVSSLIMAGLLRECAPPAYPEGVGDRKMTQEIILEVAIDVEGAVSRIHTLSGNPMLRLAAEEAVREWQYAPYLLDGRPAPAVSTVTIRFPGPSDESEDETARCYGSE